MRRLLVPCLFAVLAFLPWSALPARTPPPQGWEERDLLRARRGELQRYVEKLRNELRVQRSELQPLEAARREVGWQPLWRPDPLAHKRQLMDSVARSLADREQELARIEKKLGLGP
jgi:hypothetical protein